MGSGRTTGLAAAGIVLVAAASAFAYSLVKPSLEEKRRFDAERDSLARRVAQESAQVDELNNKCLRFETDPDFVEHEARRNHRVFPGETEFVFGPSE